MGRHCYSDDGQDDYANLWRANVLRAVHSKRGQLFLKELVTALDAMPEKKLIAEELQTSDGVCAIGCVGAARGIDMSKLDTYDYDTLASIFKISALLVREIEYINDEGNYHRETPEQRWLRVRAWVAQKIKGSS